MACTPGTSQPLACGKTGSTCSQTCQTNGTYGACMPSGATTAPDYNTDINNCGQCGNVCPTPLHASAKCVAGVCGRTPCEAGWYDWDGEVSTGQQTGFGCEVNCPAATPTTCAKPNGSGGTTTVNLTAAPLPESGLVFHAIASGSSVAGTNMPQTNSTHTNMGILGQPSPVSGDPTNGPMMQGGNYKHLGGFMPIDSKH